MAADGTLNYNVSADTGNFTSGMRAASKGLRGMGAGISAMLGPLAAVTGAISGIAALGKSLRGAANLETISVQFRTLVGDAKLAEKTLGQIKELSSSSGLAFPDLADAAAKMASFGLEASTIPGVLARLSDTKTPSAVTFGPSIYGVRYVSGEVLALVGHRIAVPDRPISAFVHRLYPL